MASMRTGEVQRLYHSQLCCRIEKTLKLTVCSQMQVVNNTDSLKLTQFPSALSLTACSSSATVQRVGEAIGNELSPIGINWVYGPVLDIVSDLTEPFDASSRFGGDASTVGSLALAFIKGLRKSRIASCVMGTLATTIEETYASLIQDDSKEDVAQGTDPEGFEALWRLRGENCLDSLQLSSSVHSLHYPIQLGRSIQLTIRSILRERLDFQGPVLLDCSSLPLESIECTKHAPVRAFLGDCDMVRLSNDHDLQIASIEAIYAAAESGSLRESASANAAARVSTMKDQCSSWDLAFAERKDLSAILTVNADLAQATYRESITVLSTGPSPLLNLPTTAVLVLLAPTLLSQALPASLTNTVASDPFEPLGRALSRSHPRIRHVPYTLSGGLTSTHMTFLNLASAVVLVLCNASTAFSEAQDELASAVQTAVLQLESVPGSKVIRKVVLAAGDPRDLRGDWTGWWASCCYEYTRGALNAAAEVISGERVAAGVLPLQLP